LNQRLFLIEKETDSSYQIGSFGINSPLSPGHIAGWFTSKNDFFHEVFTNNEEYIETISKIQRINKNEILTKEKDLEIEEIEYNMLFTINKKRGSEIFQISKKLEDSDNEKYYSYYFIREKDTDSTYMSNFYKDKERDELIQEYGEEYEKFLVDEGIESYQHTPDYIYMKYILKNHYKDGTFIEDGCEFLIKEKVSNRNGMYRFINDGKTIFLYNDYKFYKEIIKYIYKDGDQYVVISDILPKENNNRDNPNMILKDRILHIRKQNNTWVATESFGTEVEYKNLPKFYINAKSGLNVREKPSIKGEKLTKLNYNEKVYVTDTLQVATIGKVTGKWLEIQFPGIKGYIFSPYISKLPNSKSPDE